MARLDSGAGLRGRVPEHTGGGFEAVVRALLVVVHDLEEKHHRLRVLLEALLQQLRNPIRTTAQRHGQWRHDGKSVGAIPAGSS